MHVRRLGDGRPPLGAILLADVADRPATPKNCVICSRSHRGVPCACCTRAPGAPANSAVPAHVLRELALGRRRCQLDPRGRARSPAPLRWSLRSGSRTAYARRASRRRSPRSSRERSKETTARRWAPRGPRRRFRRSVAGRARSGRKSRASPISPRIARR